MLAWRSDAAWLHHRLGNTADALDLAEAEHELATAWGAPAPIGRALRARGAMTPGAEGVALLRAAAEILDDSENQLEQARTHLLLGARLARSGSDDAEVHLRRGRALAEAGSGPGLVEQELRLLADQGPNPAGSAGSRLTKAERRVVALAAGGQTNQAIADELAVTRRAVEKHLTNAYHKLNIPGRAELADAWELEQAAMDPGELS
jgi:DNA-binding CsgD family transcriptional regulator